MRQVRIKICGITRAEDADAACAAGADYLGFVFHPPSPRNVSAAAAGAIIRRLHERHPRVRTVGLFVDRGEEEIAAIRDVAGFDLAQLHGGETPELCAALHSRSIPVMKVLKFGPGAPAVDWRRFAPTYFLCDTFDTARAGGTGRTFDTTFLPPDMPMDCTFIAGGLNPDNVAAVVERLRPFAVDVSSAVESAPGRKSPELMERFVRAARGVNR